jgi:hypothetical protein
MNFTDYFIKGLRNTLKLKAGLNLSFKGQEIAVPAATVIDTWAVGEFSSATYEIVAEYGQNDVERINATVTGRVNQASITVFGRTNVGKDLIQLSAVVDSSTVSVIATPFYKDFQTIAGGTTSGTGGIIWVINYTNITGYGTKFLTEVPVGASIYYSAALIGVVASIQSDTQLTLVAPAATSSSSASPSFAYTISTPSGTTASTSSLTGVKLTFKATYAEKIIPSGIPETLGETSNSNGELGITKNWINTNLPDGFLGINQYGSIQISNISKIAVPSQPTLSAGFIFERLNLVSDSSMTITTNATSRTTTFQLNGINSLSVDGTFVATPATTGNINNATVGQSASLAGTFTALSSTGTTIFSSNNQQIPLTPTGTGAVIINSGVAGNINNLTVGAGIRASGAFTNLSASNTVSISPAQNVTMIATGTGKVTLSSPTLGTVNNISFGASTAAPAKFTSITLTQSAVNGDQLIPLNRLTTILLGAGV